MHHLPMVLLLRPVQPAEYPREQHPARGWAEPPPSLAVPAATMVLQLLSAIVPAAEASPDSSPRKGGDLLPPP